MKNRYMTALQESLIDMSKMEKHVGTVDNIINYRGNGSMATHQKATDIVGVLERMYKEEDGDEEFLQEMDEAGIENKDSKGEGVNGEEPVAAGDTTTIQPDHSETDLSRVADNADGAGLPNGNGPDDFSNNIVDKDRSVVEALFEEDDLDLPEDKDDEDDADVEQPVNKVAENTEPNHEAQGTPSRAPATVAVNVKDGGTVGDRGLDESDEDGSGKPLSDETKPLAEMGEDPMAEEEVSMNSEPDGDEIPGGVADSAHQEPDGDEVLPEGDELDMPVVPEVTGPGGHIPDGTGPNGRGMGPGQGQADGSGMPESDIEEVDEEPAVDPMAAPEVAAPEVAAPAVDPMAAPEVAAPAEDPLNVDAETEGCQECGDMTLEELIEMGEEDLPMSDVATEPAGAAPGSTEPEEVENPIEPTQMENTIIARKGVEEKIVEKLIREMEDMTDEEGDDSPEIETDESIDLESLFDQD